MLNLPQKSTRFLTFYLHSGYYDVGPYFLTKGLVDIPWMLLSTTLYAVITLPIAGLQYENAHMIYFIFALLMLQLVAQRLLHFILC